MLTEILLLSLLGEVPLPGTQPNELTIPPEYSGSCGCHDSFTNEQVTEPGESYRATMMALSARDPLFRAALQVSFADRPDLTDLCLRCHAPVGWLNGRSEPADGSLLQVEDLDSVTCDMCHRMIPADPPLIGDGQFTLSSSIAKRAPRGAAPGAGGHDVIADSYVSSSEMCGVCHSLFNPEENAHDANGTDLGVPYYEQRTYEEWVDSIFPGQDKSCISCHMSRAAGAAVRGGDEYPDLAVHNFTGGNVFAVKAVSLLNPNLAIEDLIPRVVGWVDEQLESAAELEIVSTDPSPLMVESGEEFTVTVRVTNKTGHKLPTGYPEGRRVYLEVTMDYDGFIDVLSGYWDPETGNVERDDQLRTYETEHGRVENGVGARTRHLIRMNQIMLDTRIPPEGFMPSHPDMAPSGRDYGAPPYRHWDEHTYKFTAPTVGETTTGTVTVRAMYQTTDGEVVGFLLEQTEGTPEHDDLSMAWEMLERAIPRQMVRADLPITVVEKPAPPPPDAGMAEVDAGVEEPKKKGGCSCVAGAHAGKGVWFWAMMAVALLLLRKR